MWRGDIGGSAKKVGLRIKELERIYGIRAGSAGNSHTNNFNGDNPQTEKELAKRIGVTQQTLQNYKQLANMIPELSELVDTGIITKTTALSIMRNLSEQEQEELIFNFSVKHRKPLILLALDALIWLIYAVIWYIGYYSRSVWF